jgi:cysteine desulfurase
VRSYLDHASASPMRPEVIDALRQVLEVAQADPGRPYEEAVLVRQLIEDARDSVARLVGARSRQIVFEASIAESITHAVSCLDDGSGALLISAAARRSALEVAGRSGRLESLDVDGLGHLRLDELERRLAAGGVAMVSAQVANHETGVLDDAALIVDLAHQHGAAVHLDASLAPGRCELDLGELGAEALTIAGELIGGPLGTAATVVRRGFVLAPLIVGGAQERARRAGLENLLGIVGFGVAAELLADPVRAAEERRRTAALLMELEAAALEIDGVISVGDRASRAAGICCLVVDGVEAEPVLIGLDRAGVSVHSGSACAAESLEPSPVLAAMGLDADRSLRLSTGWSSTETEVERFCGSFGEVISSLRALRT